MLLFSVYGLAEENLFTPTLLKNYAIWSELFGVHSISDKLETLRPDDDTTRLSMDLISIDSNRNTLAFEKAILIYKYPGYSEAEMDLRALALFAAIEYGKPVDYSSQETKSVRTNAMTRLAGMKQTIYNNYEQFENGDIIPFYVGAISVYHVCQVADDIQCIIVD